MNTAKTIIYAPQPPGNYLQDYNDTFRHAGRRYPGMNLDALAELAAYGKVALEASCWVLNNAARDFIMHTTLPDDALQDWRLPYPRMTIEWCGTWDLEAVAKKRRENDQLYVPALERIILLSETTTVGEADILYDSDTGKIKNKTATCHDDFSGFYLTSFYKHPSVEPNLPIPWRVNPVSLLIPYSAFNHLSKWFNKADDGDLNMQPVEPTMDIRMSDERPMPLCSLNSAPVDLWRHMIADGTAKEGVRDLIEEVHIALGLLAMLRCDNVPVKVVKASALKQKRRKQQKKTRIPDYRVLHLSDHTLRGYAGGKPAHGEKSPHWRRGHIRNQHTAMGPVRKWIAPQIIRADKLTDGDLPKPRTAIT